ncbi:MAG: hypothetical protein OXG11_00595, partial [Chloroflexi bacterium]|nr:hypothetical protein [Chloroflexota bacterium]
MSTSPALDFLQHLWQAGEVRELRIPKHDRFNHTASGYFDSPEKLAIAASKWNGRANIYVSLNPVDPALLARANNRIVDSAKNTTTDQNVIQRTGLFIDIDPVRPSGISSTDEELAESRSVADAVADHLNSQSWPDPIVAISGNGYYVLYRINLPNSLESNSLVKSVLETLASRLNTREAHIDVSVANAAQLIGLIGTEKVKGDAVPDRPHRVSKLVQVPGAVGVVGREQLEAIVPETDDSTAVSGDGKSHARGAGMSLAETLDRHSIEFREQPSDANGVTWYHVQQCPFHEDASPFKCGVGQKLPDGPLAGHCFHPEGQGKSWHDWKLALGLKIGKPTASASSNGQLPEIVVSGRHLREIVSDSWQALRLADGPPSLFEYGGTLVEVRRSDSSIKIEPLSAAALKGRLDRSANFMKSSKGEKALVPARPPSDVVEDMLALDIPLPHLKALASAPVFDENWQLVDSPGYQPSTRLFFESNSRAVPQVPGVPTDEDVGQAKSLLLDEWSCDFPFAAPSSRAHAVAALLSQLLGNRIDGPIPLFAVDAPTAGSGKSLLVESVGLITTGSAPATMTLPRKDDDLRKQITSVLLGGSPVVLLDNVTHTLESGVLAAALTSRTWSDRLLGKSETVSVPNNCLWFATGNNLQLGSEIVRRAIWIRLDPKVDRPWERTGFKHDPLPPWVVENRGRLLWALLVLVRHWIAVGRPAWQGRQLGSFESWCGIVGGILTSAGLTGFLDNHDELYRLVDQESEEWRVFAQTWWSAHRDRPVKARDLVSLVRDRDLIPGVFASVREPSDERAMATCLGKALSVRRDRAYGDLFIRKPGRDS